MLLNAFALTAFPDVMVSYNATIFTSDCFQKFFKEAEIFQKFVAPGNLSTNGLIERSIEIFKHRWLLWKLNIKQYTRKSEKFFFAIVLRHLLMIKHPLRNFIIEDLELS